MNIDAVCHGGAVCGVDVASVVFAGLAGDEGRAAVELESTRRGQRKARCTAGALVTLELSGLGCQRISLILTTGCRIVWGMILTGNNTSTTLTIGDNGVRETELSSRQSSVANTHLAITELTERARGTT